MKLIVKTMAVAAVMAAGLGGASQALAGSVCNGCSYQGNGTYLGAFNPTINDQSSGWNNTFGTGGGSFTDTWAFTINPAGSGTINATFLPTGSISNFLVELYATAAPTSCLVPASTCGSLTLGALIATGSPSNSHQSNIAPLNLAAGTYAFVLTGTYSASQFSNGYSGNLTTAPLQIPEPASLALAGIALLGAAAARRRKSA